MKYVFHSHNQEVVASLMARLPSFVVDLWKKGIYVMVGGSFNRLAIHPNEVPNDIDLYGNQEVIDKVLSLYAVEKRGLHSVDLNVPGCERKVNLVDKMPFDTPSEYLRYVDFSISAALLHPVMVFGKSKLIPTLTSIIEWEDHVREKKIVFIRNVTSGSPNSLPRVLKLYRQGYTIDPQNLAAVVCGLLSETKINVDPVLYMEIQEAFIKSDPNAKPEDIVRDVASMALS